MKYSWGQYSYLITERNYFLRQMCTFCFTYSFYVGAHLPKYFQRLVLPVSLTCVWTWYQFTNFIFFKSIYSFSFVSPEYQVEPTRYSITNIPYTFPVQTMWNTLLFTCFVLVHPSDPVTLKSLPWFFPTTVGSSWKFNGACVGQRNLWALKSALF